MGGGVFEILTGSHEWLGSFEGVSRILILHLGWGVLLGFLQCEAPQKYYSDESDDEDNGGEGDVDDDEDDERVGLAV